MPVEMAGKAMDVEAVRRGELERIAVAVGKQPAFAPLAAAPHRPHGVDHIAGRQIEAGRDLGLAGGAAAERGTRVGQFGPGGAMDGAADPAARRQRLVGGVDDGVDIERGDIAFDGVDPGRHGSIAGRNGLAIKPLRDGLTGRGDVMLYHLS